MKLTNAVIAIYPDHAAADAAVRKLAGAGFAFDSLSVVGKGFHTDEHAVGFYNIGDRIRFWGTRGAFWGGLWGLFLGGLFVTIPATGPVILLGYLAATAITAIESAALVGGLSALGAALASLGIPKDSVVQYESEVKADGYLVMAHGTPAETERARMVLATTHPARLHTHEALTPAPASPAPDRVPA